MGRDVPRDYWEGGPLGRLGLLEVGLGDGGGTEEEGER